MLKKMPQYQKELSKVWGGDIVCSVTEPTQGAGGGSSPLAVGGGTEGPSAAASTAEVTTLVSPVFHPPAPG